MGKTINFKANFSKLLADKYHMTDKGIKGYWANKEKEEEYNNKKTIAAVVGAGEMVGTLGFTLWDTANGADCGTAILVAGAIGVLTTVIALKKSNPYTKAEYEEIDEVYDELKARVSKKNKKLKRK